MNKILIYWGIILLVFLHGCTSKTIEDKEAQANNDSIKKYLDLAGNDSITYDKRIKYNDKAYSLIDLNRNDTLTRYNLYYAGINYCNLLQFKKLEESANILFILSFKSKNQLSIANSYKLKGLNYMFKSKNDQAIESFYKSKKIFLKLNSTKQLIALNKDIAQVQLYSSDFLGSNKTLFENFKLIKIFNKNINFDLYRNYSTIASNFSYLKDYKNSIKYENEGLKYVNNNLRFVNISYCGIADSYIQLKEYDKAQYYIDLILENPKSKIVNPQNFYKAKSMNGYLKLVQNKISGLPNLFFEAENYYSKNDHDNGQNYNQINLSKYYEKINDTINAIKAANKAVSISKSYNNPSDILITLEQLIKVDKKNASTNAKEYIRINDSLQISERNFRDKFARIAYETDKISQEKETAIKQKWIIVTIAGVIIVIIVLLLIITRQRSKQKELQLQQSQQKANEEIYHLMLTQKAKEDEARQTEKKRIARELHDGIMNKLSSTRLNLSILTNKTDTETIQKCLTYINQINQIETDIRNISHDLNQDVFQEEDSFRIMIEDFVNEQNTTSKTHYELELDNDIDWNAISSEIKMHLYRIIQEASHNINKYGQAKKASISLVLDAPNICMAITDNGIGFDTSVISKGIGIQNMQARVKLLNGKFSISSTKHATTSVNIAIPIK
jgi:signal transduction histidine kinase